MKTSAMAMLMAITCLAGEAAAQADVDVDIRVRVPGVTIHIGDRDSRGRYWDGSLWREEVWWREHCHRLRGHKDFRGECLPPHRHCPPGQAKKGRC